MVRGDGTADCLDSNAAASVWKFMHLAAGSSFVVVFRADAASANDNEIFDTCTRGGGNVGQMLSFDAAAYRLEWRVANGLGAYHFALATTAAGVAKNVWHVVAGAWDSATGYSLRINGGAPFTGATAGAASAADPAATLRLLARDTVAANWFRGDVAALGLYAGRISDASLTRLERWALRLRQRLAI